MVAASARMSVQENWLDTEWSKRLALQCESQAHLSWRAAAPSHELSVGDWLLDYPANYPLGLAPWAEALLYDESAAPTCALSRLFRRLNASAPVAGGNHSGASLRFVVIGGSVVAGQGCSTPGAPLPWAAAKQAYYRDGLHQCAWPARWQHALRAAYPHTELVVDNLALPGTTTSGFLPMLHSILEDREGVPPVAALLVDFSANDASQPAEDVLASVEQLVRYMLRVMPHIALMLVDGFCFEPSTHHAAMHHVSHHYGVPLVRFHSVINASGQQCDALWRVVSVASNSTRMHLDKRTGLAYLSVDVALLDAKHTGQPRGAQGRAVHPSWPTHQLIADTVAAAWHRLGSSVLCWTSISAPSGAVCKPRPNGGPASRVAPLDEPPPLPSPLSAPQLLAKYDVCEVPLSAYHALEAFHQNSTGGSGAGGSGGSMGWSLREDRAGKPGWIATRVGARQTFEVRFGERPRLSVVYMRGYSAEWGTAKVQGLCSLRQLRPQWSSRGLMGRRFVQGFCEDATTLRGLRSDGMQVTQSEVQGINLAWMDAPPNSTRTLQVSLTACHQETCKFKLVSLTSC